MKHRLLDWLACPACRSESLRLERRRTTLHRQWGEGAEAGARDEIDVIEGALHCEDCGAVYPIREGIPRMLPEGADEGPDTAHRWTTFDATVPEWEESFLDYAWPLNARDFLGRLVLDAGCGYGRHAFYAGRYGADVVAIDASADAVAATARNCRNLARVHVVQGDIYRLPVRDGLFDLVYCFGVLHHLDDPRRAFDALGAAVRAGGRLALWVYGPRQGFTLHASNALRGLCSGLDPEQLYRLSQVIASGLRLFSHTPYRLLQQVPVARTVVSHLPVHDHHRWPYRVVVADIYDRLRIPVKHWFTGEQLETWLVDAGYADIQVSRRVANNETFRAQGVRR